ncbi:hypothetical protein [Leptolyngbya sp. GGD]|uniref:hypothetical protein n=1 Tax=Leptolyngbya sp. GGD TaxID=2997907 RepID=UPI00227CAF7C|nr:hypothetical protein [Leptolyngbya sp. GGD]MCY6491323.1 hypothetical protein [Leptolyngbya sp. GGD]
MTELDFVLLTVYFLCVTYVLYQIVNSFNDEVMVWLDEDDLKQQLADQNLTDAVGVSFKFNSRYEYHNLEKLQIRINNKTKDRALYVDWDYCVLTEQYDKRSRRVTRSVPGDSTDLFQRQVFSVIAPGKTLFEDIFAEDMMARKDSTIKASKTLIDFSEPNKKAPEAKKKLYKNFVNSKEPFQFDLDLVLRFIGFGTSPTGDRIRLVCRFNVRKLDWTAGLPWNPKMP